jgi:hypothetical protein
MLFKAVFVVIIFVRPVIAFRPLSPMSPVPLVSRRSSYVEAEKNNAVRDISVNLFHSRKEAELQEELRLLKLEKQKLDTEWQEKRTLLKEKAALQDAGWEETINKLKAMAALQEAEWQEKINMLNVEKAELQKRIDNSNETETLDWSEKFHSLFSWSNIFLVLAVEALVLLHDFK